MNRSMVFDEYGQPSRLAALLALPKQDQERILALVEQEPALRETCELIYQEFCRHWQDEEAAYLDWMVETYREQDIGKALMELDQPGYDADVPF